jgi:hypothetical protein
MNPLLLRREPLSTSSGALEEMPHTGWFHRDRPPNLTLP